jgi:hypothetical protein
LCVCREGDMSQPAAPKCLNCRHHQRTITLSPGLGCQGVLRACALGKYSTHKKDELPSPEVQAACSDYIEYVDMGT